LKVHQDFEDQSREELVAMGAGKLSGAVELGFALDTDSELDNWHLSSKLNGHYELKEFPRNQ
jgi:hypothetical protein